VDSLAFSPDGKYLAVTYRIPGEETMASGDTAGMPIDHPVLFIRKLADGQPVLTQDLAGRGCGQYQAWDLAYSQDGQTLVFRDSYSWNDHDRADSLCLLSALDGSLLRAIAIELPSQSSSPAVFTADGEEIVVAVAERNSVGEGVFQIRTYSAHSGALVQQWDASANAAGTTFSPYGAMLALSPDGGQVALADGEGAQIYSTRDGSWVGGVGHHSREVTSVAFSPDSASLALGSLDGTVSLWDVAEKRLRWQSQAWTPVEASSEEDSVAEIWHLGFSPDGAVLFALAPSHVAATPGRVVAWRAVDGQEAFSVAGNSGSSWPALAPDGTRVVMGGYEDGLVQMWSAPEDQPLFDATGQTGMVLAVRFSPDARQFATASGDGTVRLWNAQDGSLIALLLSHAGPVRDLQYAPGGTTLASLDNDGTVRIWASGDGALQKTFSTQTGAGLANALTFSPDGASLLVATGCLPPRCATHGVGDLRRIDLLNGDITIVFAQPVFRASFSANQDAIAILGLQGEQTGLFNQGQYQLHRQYESPLGNGALIGEALTPDGQLFFSGNEFGLHVWDVSSGEMLALVRGANLPYGRMWVTPDQKMVVIAQTDGLMSLWGVRH
jgi:WD40 repeat protein